MTALDDNEYIVQLITKYYPLEAELVGTNVIHAIVNGGKPAIPEEGESFDITPILNIIVSITAIINNIVAIYVLLYNSKKEKPTFEEFRNATKEIDLPELNNTEKDKLLQDLLTTVEEPKKPESK